MFIPDRLNDEDHWMDLITIDKATNFICFPTVPIKWKEIGVYILKHTLTNSFYIGSSINIMRRLYEHRIALVKCINSPRKLQEVFEKDPCIKVKVFYLKSREEAFDLEQELINLNIKDSNICNIATDARRSAYGRPVHLNTVNAAIKANTGRSCTEENKLKISVANKGRIPTQEHRDKISRANTGKHIHTTEARLEISKRLIGNKFGVGRVVSEETRKNISEKQKGIPKPQWLIDKYKAAWKEKRNSGYVSTRAIPIMINGIEYKSTNIAAKELGIKASTVWGRATSKSNTWEKWYYIN